VLKRFALYLAQTVLASIERAAKQTVGLRPARAYIRLKPFASHPTQKALEAIASHPQQDSCDAIRLMTLTGARKGEVFTARWEDIDLEAGIWSKPSAHTKDHIAPRSGTAVQLLKRRKETGAGQWVFACRWSGSWAGG
jgi:integrase